MKEFNNYQFANITESTNSKIKECEDEIKSQTGKEIVLIAYEEKQN